MGVLHPVAKQMHVKNKMSDGYVLHPPTHKHLPNIQQIARLIFWQVQQLHRSRRHLGLDLNHPRALQDTAGNNYNKRFIFHLQKHKTADQNFIRSAACLRWTWDAC